MKALLKTMLVMVAMVTGGAANAIDLRNEGEVPYTVTVTSTAMSRDIESRPYTLNLIVCVGVCELDVAGVGKVQASKNDIVTIKDGKVTITSREANVSVAK